MSQHDTSITREEMQWDWYCMFILASSIAVFFIMALISLRLAPSIPDQTALTIMRLSGQIAVALGLATMPLAVSRAIFIPQNMGHGPASFRLKRRRTRQAIAILTVMIAGTMLLTTSAVIPAIP